MPLYRIDDFTGGQTDKYLDGNPNAGQKVENLVLDEHGELVQRPGIGKFDVVDLQILPGNQRIDGVWYYDETVFVKSAHKLYYWDTSDGSQTDWTELSGPSNDAFEDNNIAGDMSVSEWQGHLFFAGSPNTTSNDFTPMVKVFRNSSGTWTLLGVGMPTMSTSAHASSIITGGTGGYTPGADYTGLYRWYWTYGYEYTAKVNGDNVTFFDESNAVEIHRDEAFPISSSATYDFSGGTVSVPSNGSTFNYPTSDILVYQYRTTINGFVPKLEGTIEPGVDTQIADDDIEDTELGRDLYIGDLRNPVLDNDRPPRVFYSEIIDGRLVCAGCEDVASGEFYGDRVMESKPNNPNAFPSGNYVDVGEEIRGLGHVGPYPIVFSESKCWRIEGHFDLYGRGYMRARLISETEGCVSHKGIVRHKNWLMFPSLNGFCWTDGFEVINVTDPHLRSSYQSLNTKVNIAGTLDRANRRVIWAARDTDSSPVHMNNVCYVLDLRYPINKESGGVFTTWRSDNENMQFNCLHYADESEDVTQVLIGDSRGWLLTLKDDQKYDLTIGTSGSVDDFASQPIIPDFISSAVQGSAKKLTLWMTKVFCIFKNLTGDLSLTCGGYDDDTGTSYALLPVRQRNVTGIHKFKRWWNRSYLRGIYKQFWVKKGDINIAWSDQHDTASTSGTTVTIDSGSWPTYDGMDLTGYYIYFDGSSTGYRITAQSGSGLTVASSAGTQSNVSWEIKGAPKTEGFHLKSIAMEFEVLGESYGGYARDTDVGGNS